MASLPTETDVNDHSATVTPREPWLLENTHPGETHFEFENGDGCPSRWNTLRAVRVLNWYDGRR